MSLRTQMNTRVDIKKANPGRSASGSMTRTEGYQARNVRCHRRTLSMVERQVRNAEGVASTHMFKFLRGTTIMSGWRLYDLEEKFNYDVNTVENIRKGGRVAYVLVEATLLDDGNKGTV